MNIKQAESNFREMLQLCATDCVCIDCFFKHVKNGCYYGAPDGLDDIIKECDCYD